MGRRHARARTKAAIIGSRLAGRKAAMPSAVAKPARAAKSLLHDGKISAGQARVLLSCAEPDALAEKIVAQNLSVRDAEKLLEGAPESSGAKGEGTAQARPRGKRRRYAGDGKDANGTARHECGDCAQRRRDGATGWCATKPSTSWSFCAAACRAIDARRTALKGRPGSGWPTAMPSRFRAHTPT